jgi:argininosuccinate lyase
MQNFARLSTGLSQDLIQDLMNPTLQRDFGLFFRPLMAINRAHVVMLAECEILGESDAATILRGLDTVDSDLMPTTLRPDIDLYYNVERRLQAGIGAVAGGCIPRAAATISRRRTSDSPSAKHSTACWATWSRRGGRC